MITGDLAESDDEGYLWFRGRQADVITSSGYRIGPTEIEDAIVAHPKGALAAVIGVPDPERTEVIKAFVVPAAGCSPKRFASRCALVSRDTNICPRLNSSPRSR